MLRLILKAMFCPSAGLSIALLCLVASPSRGGDPASAALRHLEEAFGASALANVVAISGSHDAEPPGEWRILIRDLQSDVFVHEFLVKDGQVFGPSRLAQTGPALPPSRPTLSGRNLAVDSPHVFQICDQLAASSGVGFDRLTFHLEWRSGESHPTWLATLIDERRNRIVGHVFVSAGDGTVVRQQFFPASEGQPRNLRPVSGKLSQTTAEKPASSASPAPPAQHRYGARDVP